MNSFIRTLVSALAAVPLAMAIVPLAHAADVSALEDAQRKLAAAVNTGQAQAVLEARSAFVALAAAEPGNPAPLYWTVVADWRITGFARNDGKEAVKRYCEPALENAEKLVAMDPKSAEAIALLAGLQGLSMAYRGPSAGMTLGPRMESEMGRALGMAPDNPRVRFLDALNTLHKPAFVGGGPKQALPKFEQAIEAFERERAADPAAVTWGHDDAELWAGRCAMKLKDHAGAKRHYERALEINPANGWVRHSLLPEAEQALSASTTKKDRS